MPNILTAREFIAQGTTAGAIMSIAAYNSGETAERLSMAAREVAKLTGQSLRIPGAVNDARRAANDNRRRANNKQHGQPRNRRVA